MRARRVQAAGGSVEPGHTNTELNSGTGTQTVTEGADIIANIAQPTDGREHSYLPTAVLAGSA